MGKALSDITVIDLGQVIAMPYCTMLLADMGANVIKIEERAQGQQRLSLGIKRVRNEVEERVPVHYRERTGKGQRIDIALLDSLITALDNLGERYTVGGEILTRAGNISFGGSSSGVYSTTDGYVAIAAGSSDNIWRRFCQIVGEPELTNNTKFSTAAARREHRDEVAAIIQKWTAVRTKAEVVDILANGGVPAAPVNNVAEMVSDPQVQAREMFVEVEHPIYGPVKITGTPLKLSETPGRIESLAPLSGEHHKEIFIGLLGHSKEELSQWHEEGVI